MYIKSLTQRYFINLKIDFRVPLPNFLSLDKGFHVLILGAITSWKKGIRNNFRNEKNQQTSCLRSNIYWKILLKIISRFKYSKIKLQIPHIWCNKLLCLTFCRSCVWVCMQNVSYCNMLCLHFMFRNCLTTNVYSVL